MRTKGAPLGLCLLLLGSRAAAQHEGRIARVPAGRLEYGSLEVRAEDDRVFVVFGGWFRLRTGDLFLRADRAVLALDRDAYQDLFRPADRGQGPPHAGLLPPEDPKALWTRDLVSGLLELGLEPPLAEGRGGRVLVKPGDELIRLARGLVAEGHVVLEHGGRRKAACRRLVLSLDAHRTVLDGVELRLPAGTGSFEARPGFVLRCRRAVQQGRRLVADAATLTTCAAGRPHYALASESLVVTRRDGVLEFVGRGNRLRLAGLPALPLPDFHWFSDQENWLPLKGVRGGRSDAWGEFAFVRLGGGWNDLGGAVVEAAGGRREDFRGEWNLRTGFSAKRGTPFEGDLSYRLAGVFEGRTDGFVLDDSGRDRAAMRRRLDGTPIRTGVRSFVRSRNRLHLGAHTKLDLELFQAGDPAALPEFRRDELKRAEPPETSADFVTFRRNLRFGARVRSPLVDFAYGEDAALTPSFREERPRVRFDVFSQPLLDLGGGWPLVLDLGAEGARLHNRFSRHAKTPGRQATWRSDLDLRLRSPRRFGVFMAEPYFDLRETWFSDLAGGGSGFRKAFEAGGRLTTRFYRDFGLSSLFLGLNGLRHEVLPEVRGFHRFVVDREPGEYFAFDETDALDEESAIDLNLLQRFRTRDRDGAYRDWLWLDLTQRIWPNAARDHSGEQLGLFSFELIWRPRPAFSFLFEGERDWRRGDYRTRNIGVSLLPAEGFQLAFEWRSGLDRDGEGSIFGGAAFWRRWFAGYRLIYDFDAATVNSQSLLLRRRDHDWTFEIALTQDQVIGDTRISLNFVPAFLGAATSPIPEWVDGDPAFGVRNTGPR